MLDGILKLSIFKVPELRYERIYWIIFLVIIGTILFGAVSKKKSSTTENIEVNVRPLSGGEMLISEQDVRIALNRSFGSTLDRTELADMEVERIERELEKDPFVLDAESYIDQLNVLHVDIKQRPPMVRILDVHGDNYYFDDQGVRMPPSKNYTAHVLVATGHLPIYTPDFLEEEQSRLQDLLVLSRTILADKDLAGFVQQIHVNNAGEFILIPLVGDQKVILGSVRDLEEKLERLKIFYKEGMPYAGWSTYKTINLTYKDQIVCKK